MYRHAFILGLIGLLASVGCGFPPLESQFMGHLPILTATSTGTYILGKVWEDLNGNGSQDIGEQGLSNRLVILDQGQEAFTDSFGGYIFSGVLSGQHYLNLISGPDEVLSYPLSWDVGTGNQVLTLDLGNGTGSILECMSISVDSYNNLYVGGYFTGQVDFDLTSGTDIHNAGTLAVYITQIRADGSYGWTWAAEVGNQGSLDTLLTTPTGIYAGGSFSNSSVNFGGNQTSDIQELSGKVSAFLTHLTLDGTYQWTQVYGGPDSHTTIRDLASDTQGNLFATGHFSKTVDFDAKEGTVLKTAPNMSIASPFFLRLTSAGDLLWVKTVGNWDYNKGVSVTVDPVTSAGYFVGTLRGTIDIDPGPAKHNLFGKGDWDTYILKLDSDGEFLWAKHVAGADMISPFAALADPAGNLYVAGTYSGDITFNYGSLEPEVRDYSDLTETGRGFLLKLFANGDHAWVHLFDDDSTRSAATGLTRDATGTIFVSGENTAADLDPNAFRRSNVFLSAFSPSGEHLQKTIIDNLLFTDIYDYGTQEWVYRPYMWRCAATSRGELWLAGRHDPTNHLPNDTKHWRGYLTKFASPQQPPLGHVIDITELTPFVGLDFGVQPISASH